MEKMPLVYSKDKFVARVYKGIIFPLIQHFGAGSESVVEIARAVRRCGLARMGIRSEDVERSYAQERRASSCSAKVVVTRNTASVESLYSPPVSGRFTLGGTE